MPITSQVDEKRKLIRTQCTGVLTLDDFFLYKQSLWADREYYGFNELFDISQADFSRIEFADLLTLAKHSNSLITLDPDSKLAILVSSQKQTELTEFYRNARGMLPNKSRIMKVFHSGAEALEWLTSNHAVTSP